MSLFSTKIFLATDESEDAELATTTVAALAKSTGSELHLRGRKGEVYEPAGKAIRTVLARPEPRGGRDPRAGRPTPGKGSSPKFTVPSEGLPYLTLV